MEPLQHVFNLSFINFTKELFLNDIWQLQKPWLIVNNCIMQYILFLIKQQISGNFLSTFLSKLLTGFLLLLIHVL